MASTGDAGEATRFHGEASLAETILTWFIQVIGVAAAIIFGLFSVLSWTDSQRAKTQSEAANLMAFAALCGGQNVSSAVASLCSSFDIVAAPALSAAVESMLAGFGTGQPSAGSSYSSTASSTSPATSSASAITSTTSTSVSSLISNTTVTSVITVTSGFNATSSIITTLASVLRSISQPSTEPSGSTLPSEGTMPAGSTLASSHTSIVLTVSMAASSVSVSPSASGPPPEAGNPSGPHISLDTSDKVGLAVGIGIGIPTVIISALTFLIWRRRQRGYRFSI